MQVLLDTHALLWWLSDDPALTKSARKAIAETKNTIYVSAASAWEIATKVRLGKLSSAIDLASNFTELLERELFQTLPISAEHAIRSGLLPGPHKDPFDRMLVCQAVTHGLTLLTPDRLIHQYHVNVKW